MSRKLANTPPRYVDFDFNNAPGAYRTDETSSMDSNTESPLLHSLQVPPQSHLRRRSGQPRIDSLSSQTTPHTPMSYVEWQREPSAWDVLFRLHLPYRPPRAKLAGLLWRRRVWLETTFALSMMQPWEKVVVVTVMWLSLGLLVTGICLYLPHHVRYVCGRARYYLLGRDFNVPAALKWSASYLVPWAEGNVSGPFAYAVNALSIQDEL